jgi:hypothetical protein
MSEAGQPDPGKSGSSEASPSTPTTDPFDHEEEATAIELQEVDRDTTFLPFTDMSSSDFRENELSLIPNNSLPPSRLTEDSLPPLELPGEETPPEDGIVGPSSIEMTSETFGSDFFGLGDSGSLPTADDDSAGRSPLDPFGDFDV